jgi:hypothetical protein
MSTNTFNLMVTVPADPNTYKMDDLFIEFPKSYKKEYNEMQPNVSYSFNFLYGTNDIYPMVEFRRKDSMGYIKMKNKDLWFNDDEKKGVYFDIIQCGEFSYNQPKVIWFQYPRESEVIIFKYLGYGLDSIIKERVRGITNVMYLSYKQDSKNVYLTWVPDIDDATKFIYDTIKWNELGWIKLNDPKTAAKI